MSCRFLDVLDGRPPDRTPVAPKVWIDLAARIMEVPYVEALNDPALAMKTVVRSNVRLRFDSARLFTFSRRRVEMANGEFLHLDSSGRRLGTVDVAGGWATHYDDPAQVDLSRPEIMFNYAHHQSAQPPLRDARDLDHMAIPSAAFYDETGYGRMVDETKAEVGDRLALIGDCSSGTLAFYVALRGMQQALIDFYDDPGLVRATMEKGVALCVARAHFFLRHGIRALRYNDSVANMTVISPAQWRAFIFPHLREFCRAVHAIDPQARVYCHICGNTLPIMTDLVATGLDCIAPLDPLGGMTVADVRRAVGPDKPLMGGVNTLSFVNSSTEEIAAEARRCIAEGGDRFILGSGCVVPRTARIENLQALRAAEGGRC